MMLILAVRILVKLVLIEILRMANKILTVWYYSFGT